MWSIVGDCGFVESDEFDVVETLARETPFGLASPGLQRVRIYGQEALYASRHSDHHELTRWEVNFRADIYALKRAGARAIMAFSTARHLDNQCDPGDLVIPTQFLDRNVGQRAATYCGDGLVGHVSLDHPVCEELVEMATKLSANWPWTTRSGRTFACVDRLPKVFSTQSNYYRFLGADVIGVGQFPDYALAREAGLSYLPLCFVGAEPLLNAEQVLEVCKSILPAKIEGQEPWAVCDCSSKGLREGLMTPKHLVPREKLRWLEVLLA